MDHIQNEACLITKQVRIILKNLRIKLGHDICEPYQRDHMFSRKNSCRDVFTSAFESFEDKNGNEIVRPIVYCTDIEELIRRAPSQKSLICLQPKF